MFLLPIFGNIGPPFVVNFFELLFPFVCPTFSLESEYAPHTIIHILLVKRSLVSYGALSCSIEYCALLLFQKENSKDLVLFMKTETFNAIGNSHKKMLL